MKTFLVYGGDLVIDEGESKSNSGEYEKVVMYSDVENLLKDALRYRWLRSSENDPNEVVLGGAFYYAQTLLSDEVLDEAIDKAMYECKKGQKF